MKISVIIPAYQAESTLEECLRKIYNSSYTNYEVIVIDDCSKDKTSEIAKKFNCKLIRLKKRQGAATARNIGAKLATGEILCFIDADVLIKGDILNSLAKMFNEKKVDAVIGCYDNGIKFTSFISRYKNLFNLYFFTHRKSHFNIFFTPLAAIKRDIFEKLGGFHPYKRIEDIDFGIRFIESGYKIVKEKNLKGIHLKTFSLFNLLKIKKEVYKELIFYLLRKKKLNVGLKDPIYMFSIILPPIIILLTIGGIVKPSFLFLSSSLYFLFLLLNRDFISFVEKKEGFVFSIKTSIMLFIDFFFMSIGSSIGLISFLKWQFNMLIRKILEFSVTWE